jgi:predicted RND superfamily exporter protein
MAVRRYRPISILVSGFLKRPKFPAQAHEYDVLVLMNHTRRSSGTRLEQRLYRWRFLLSAALLIGAAVLLPRAIQTPVDNDIGAWFSRNDPLYRDYDRFQLEFGGTQPLIIAFQSITPEPGAPESGLFTRTRLQFLKDITDEVERSPTVQRVQSLATAPVLRARPRAADIEDAPALDIGPALDLSKRSPDEIRRLAAGDPLLQGELVSKDGSVAALVVTFDEDRLDRDRAAILDRIYATVRSRLPHGVEAHYNGSIEINEAYNRVTLDNQRRFVPPILALTLIAVFALFRSLARTAIALISIVVSVIWTLGLYSLMGFGFNILTAMLTPLVVVLAISDDVHLIQHFDEARRRGSAADAFTTTVADLFAPLFAAGGTTALGLLSLATSDIVAVRQFGIGAAVGVMVDFASSLILVPTLLTFVAPASRRPPHERLLTGPIRRAAAFATRRPGVVLVTSAAVAAGAAAGIGRLRVDTNHINFFAATHPLSRSAAVIDRELAGVYSFHVLLEGPPGSMKSPDAIQRLDRLAAAIAALPTVRKTTSMADHVKQTHRELHEGDPGAAIVPADPQVVAQELLFFTLDEDGRREMDRVVSSDFSNAQIVVRLPSMGSDLVFETMQTSQQFATDAFAGTPIKATVTGSGRLFASLDHFLVRSQISSFITAFVTVFAAMFLVFRSIRYGLVALVPNLFPVVAVLGVMGWFGITLNVATVMVASVALGVVDDDTVHFLHRFRREVAAGRSVDDATDIAVAKEGRAALTTALINSAGFAVLILSEYKPSAWFGGLLALTLGVAFLAEVLVLPATVKLAARFLGLQMSRGDRSEVDSRGQPG